MTPRFEVYTYFGRVVSRHAWNPREELHHRASEDARGDVHDKVRCDTYRGALEYWKAFRAIAKAA